MSSFQLKQNQSNVFVVCTPSGTDAEILMTYLALCWHQKKRANQKNAPNVPMVRNIVVTANEVGSGTATACGGRYFHSFTPDGDQVSVGNGIEGIKSEDVEVIALPARNQTGAVQNVHALEKRLEQLVHESTQNGQIVVLHQVDSSKTGIKTPRLSFLKRLRKIYQDALIIVIDAAQMRGEVSVISKYINAGFCVLSSGSKFFSGSPFSGVILLPAENAFLSGEYFVAAGLGHFFAKDEVDERLAALRNRLPTRQNYGLLLRWETALANIEPYVTIPYGKRVYIISQWVKQAKKLVKETAYVNLFFDEGVESENQIDDFRHGGYNTIISFTLHPAQNGEPTEALDTESLKAVYQWMAKDISA